MRLLPHRLLPLVFLASLPGGLAIPPASASPCDGSGTVVVTDPAGDVDSPQHDITSIAVAEGFGGLETGRFRVTLRLAATSPPDSETTGLWAVSWSEYGGDSTMTLSVSRCRGDFTGTWTWQSSDGQSSFTGPLDDLVVTPGRMDLFLDRAHFGNPAPGATLSGIGATTLATDLLPPPLGCAPTLRTDVTGTGTYVMGDCVVGVRGPGSVTTAVLGPPVPNPAGAGVRMRLELPSTMRAATIEAAIVDAAGRVVRRIPVNAAGSFTSIHWDLRDDSGRRVAPGSYWARVAEDGLTESTRIVVLR